MNQSTKQSQSLKPMQFYFSGKLVSKRHQRGKSYYVAIAPAKDSYSFPSTINFGSDNTSYQVGDEIQTVLEVSGSADSYNDKSTGESIKTARIYINEVS